MNSELFLKTLSEQVDLNFDRIAHIMATHLECEPSELNSFKPRFEMITKQSFLKDILDGNEIIIHDHRNYQKLGKEIDSFNEKMTPEEYQLSLEFFCHRQNIDWNYTTPFASLFWENNGAKYRVTLIHKSLTPNKCSKIFFRKISSSPFPLSSFSVDNQIITSLEELIREKKNIIISGSTGSGKSSLLGSLIQLIPKDEHLVIMEDTHEITTTNVSHSLMLADPKNAHKSLKSYCAYALRMSPERLVLGEIRSNEVVPFILSMNTGHKGLMSTIHANSASDALSRLALLFSLFSEQKEISYQLIMKLLCTNIDTIVHMDRCSVTEVINVLGSEADRPIFELVYSRANPI